MTRDRTGHLLDWLRQPRVKTVTLRLAAVLAATIATLAVVMALALDCSTPWIEGTRFCNPLHRSTDSAASWNQRCATRAAASLPELPGVCLSNTTSLQEGCPPDPMRVTWLKQSSVRPSAMQPRWEADPSITSQTDAVTAWCSFRDVDLTLYTATVFCWLEFWGRYRNGTRFVADPSLPAKNGSSDASTLGHTTLVLLLGGSKVELKNGDVPLGVEFPLSLGQWWRRPEHVNAEYYPYTNLPFSLEFTAWWSTGDGDVDSSASEPPVVVELEFNYIPFYAVSNSRCTMNTEYAGAMRGQMNMTWYSLHGFLRLSDTAKQGVEWMNACMWALSAITCMLTLTWVVLAGPERVLIVDFGLMSFSATLLFALPTMRGMLPAVASAGTRFDVINIYGQLCLITACIAIQAVKILYTVVRADAAKETKDAAASGAAAACSCGLRSPEAATAGV